MEANMIMFMKLKTFKLIIVMKAVADDQVEEIDDLLINTINETIWKVFL